LGHGALTKHFSGDDESGLKMLKQVLCLSEHENFTINAWIEMSAKTPMRTVYEHVYKGLADIYRKYVDAKGAHPVI
jgi:hypothetical protein